MLKNAEKTEQTSHFTYEEYKRKSNKGVNKDVLVFLSVFVVGLIVLLGFAKVLSPNVDVAISVDNEIAAMEEEARTAAIDERLRHLKMEDEGIEVDEDAEKMFSPELDEKVVLPNQRKKTVGEVEAEKAAKNLTTEDLAKANDAVNAFKPVPKEDAEKIGFRDKFIYDTISKLNNNETTSIQFKCIDREETIETFNQFIEKSDKTIY